jgi:hypothetical protein
MGSEPGARETVGAMLLVAALVGLAGCSSSNADEERESTTSPTASPTDTPSPHRTRSTRYQPHPAEIDGEAKRAAARAVEALPDVRRVTYTQYFGYLPPEASILVEADFVSGGGTTYDVRISRARDGWRSESVVAASPAPALQDPGRLIRRVLDSDRIDLPWAGRVDVAAGLVSDAVLRSMLAVAEQHRIGVSVLVSAHPVHVFGTDRRSNHPDGLAYDIGSIDGRLVVDPEAAGLVRRVLRIAAGSGAYQVGGPVDLDAGGSQYFSDPTHSDHVHVGFDR